MNKRSKVQIVHIKTIDHAASAGGTYEVASPVPIDVIGILYKETNEAYYLSHMVFDRNLLDEDNVTTAVVKTPGIRKRVLGYFSVGSA